ncbi:class I SAM-dependent methyltransferase [candidate division WOR-3 bacterium]|nr:class I SAM-dependent methyltransferase [candidate division WOR-3 bacterium]
MKSDLAEWYEKSGIDFLEKIGIKKGYTVLDFGCGRGHYTVPASNIVGNRGMVYAVDKNDSALNELEKTIAEKDIKNIELIRDLKDNSLKDNSVDFVLCYDVLHYMKVSERKVVYSGIWKVLRERALLSVYPKHCKDNLPSRELADISVEEIIEEIEDTGFTLLKRFKSKLLHSSVFEEGCILNFIKGGYNAMGR